MEFKSGKATFLKKNEFYDSFSKFVSEEAALFTTEKEEAASASVDKTAEKVIRFSADKNKVKAKEQKMTSKQYHGDEKKPGSPVNASVSAKTEQLFASSNASSSEKTKELDKFTDPVTTKSKQSKETDTVANSKGSKKSISKEKKKAAAKTAVANFFRGKADMSNDLVSEKVSGDALAYENLCYSNQSHDIYKEMAGKSINACCSILTYFY